jgi:amino acid permease
MSRLFLSWLLPSVTTNPYSRRRSNVVNAIVGAGIVVLPWVIVQGGFFPAVLSIALCALMMDYSIRMMVTTGINNNVDNYQDLAFAAFGARGKFAVNACMFV